MNFLDNYVYGCMHLYIVVDLFTFAIVLFDLKQNGKGDYIRRAI